MEPVVLASARKHGLSDDDIRHASRNPMRVFVFDDRTMLIGADRTGQPLEVGTTTAGGVEFVVHALPRRGVPGPPRPTRGAAPDAQ